MASDAVVNLVVDATGADAQVRAQLTTIVNDAERRAPEINLRVDIDNASVVRAINRLDTQLADQTDRLVDTLQDGFGDLSTLLGGQLDEISDHLREVNTNLLMMDNRLDGINGDDGLRNIVTDSRDADRETSRLTATIGRLGAAGLSAGASLASIGSITSIAAAALPVVGALATELAAMAPAAAAGVTGFVALQAASATLKLGLSGVGDALEQVFALDQDPAALQEALDKLSDNAAAFVTELNTMRPAFQKLRLDVQDRLFQDLDAVVRRTAEVTFPALRRTALDMAGTFNTMGRGVGQAAQQLSREGTLGNALEGASDAFFELRDLPRQVTLAIGRLASAGAPLLNRVAVAVADLADEWTEKLGAAIESGTLTQAVNDAGDAIAQLGRIGENVFTILGNVFGTASEQGVSLFSTLERVTGVLADVTAGAAFQETLSALIDVGQTLAENILPLLGLAFEALAPAIQTLAPFVTQFVDTIGTKLAELLPEVTPLLDELAVLLGELLVAVTPLIEEGINILIEIMPDLVDLLGSTTELVRELSPLIAILAQGAVDFLVPALRITIGILQGIIDIMTFTAAKFNEVRGVIERFAQFAIRTVLVPAFLTVTALLRGDWATAWQVASRAVSAARDSISSVLANLRNTAVTILISMFGGIVTQANAGMNRFLSAIANGVANALSTFRRFVGSMVGAAAGAAGALFSAGSRMISSFIRGMLSQLGGVRDAASRLISAARDFFPFSPAKRGPLSGRGYTTFSGQKMIKDFAAGIESQRRNLSGTMASLFGSLPLIPSSVPSLSAASGAPAAFSGISQATFSRLSPTVQVFIGNEQINGHVRTIVDESTAQRDRLASQGVRTN